MGWRRGVSGRRCCFVDDAGVSTTTASRRAYAADDVLVREDAADADVDMWAVARTLVPPEINPDAPPAILREPCGLERTS
ncbi:MAG: hypothetical protein DLM57_01480 [Pseudonocardiales bacterium]|nr:MAG: hypothetical protein DLM57_01480 [Pseudonocardiales bacterium]